MVKQPKSQGSVDYDTVIIGAGPAGSSAAYRLAENGLSCLLIDRHEFPREKPCAGGLTLKTLALMPYSLAPVIEYVTTGLEIGVQNRDQERAKFKSFDRSTDICAFAVRAKFDAFNLARAIERGAKFRQVAKIDHIEQNDECVEVSGEGRTIRAKYLIGADGANSITRRLTMPDCGFYRGFAIEGLVPYAALERRPAAEFLLGYVESGYGWVFPKSDHANVGIYTNRDDVHLSKQQLRDYVKTRLGTNAIDHINGYPLGFGGENFWQVMGRVALIGDAGGYAEPLLGEGLHNAIKTGQAVAEAITGIERGQNSGTLKSSYQRLSAPVRRDIKRCRDIAYRILYPHLNGIGGAMLLHPISRHALLKGFAAGATIRTISNRILMPGLMRRKNLASLDEYHTAN